LSSVSTGNTTLPNFHVESQHEVVHARHSDAILGFRSARRPATSCKREAIKIPWLPQPTSALDMRLSEPETQPALSYDEFRKSSGARRVPVTVKFAG
jgi:hypothetical protein